MCGGISSFPVGCIYWPCDTLGQQVVKTSFLIGLGLAKLWILGLTLSYFFQVLRVLKSSFSRHPKLCNENWDLPIIYYY